MLRSIMQNNLRYELKMATTPAASDLDGPLQKMLSYTSNLKGKIEKLSEENARLKGDLSKAKASNSRVRRIPKKDAVEEVTS